MNKRDWIKEANLYLENKYAQVVDHLDTPEQKLPRFTPHLELLESKYFILGMENNLFSIDSEGYVQSEMLPPPVSHKKTQKMFQLFWRFQGGKRKLFREGVCQMAMTSFLVLHYGWDQKEVICEPSGKRFGQLSYAVDMLIEAEGRTLVCCEVKKNSREFEKLLEAFRHCCAIGQHEKETCLYKSNHPKYSICEDLRPMYFWAVAPKDQTCLRLIYKEGKIEVHEMKELPSKDEIMNSQLMG